MKYRIVPNEKTVTLVISPVHINSVKYLYERLNDSYYFAAGVLHNTDVKEEIPPMITELAKEINAVSKEKLKGETISPTDLISFKDGEKRIFGKNTDKEGNWINKEVKITLISFAKDKKFLFKDLAMSSAIDEKEAWKNIYAVELEFNAYLDKTTEEKKVFAVFHRAIKIGEKEDIESYNTNDSAWSGFDFGKKEEEEKKEDPFGDVKSNFNISDDDFSF